MERVDLRSRPRGRSAHVIERVPRLEDFWGGLDAECLVLGQGFREGAIDLRLLGLGQPGGPTDPLDGFRGERGVLDQFGTAKGVRGLVEGLLDFA
jgi:hypothetical protein